MADQEGPLSGGLQPNEQVAGVSARLTLRLNDDLLLRDLAQFETAFAARLRRLSGIAAREMDQSLNLDRFKATFDQIAVDRQRQLADIRGIRTLLSDQDRQLKAFLSTQGRLTAEYRRQLDLQRQINSTVRSAPRRVAAAPTTGAGVGTANPNASIIAQLAAEESRGAPSGAARQYELQRLAVSRLREELRQLRSVQDEIVRSERTGVVATRQAADAWLAAERRARGLEGHLSTLNRQLDRYEKQGKASARINPLGGLGTIAGGAFLGSILSGVAFRTFDLFTRSLGEGVERAVRFTASMEQASVGLRQFTRDQAEAARLTDQAIKLAIATPFSIDEVLKATRRLLAMGTAADEVIPRVRTLSAAVAAVGGNQEIFNRVILAISQIGAKSKLSMQDMRQLAEAGIPVFKILQEELGLTADQVQNIGRANIDSARGLDAILRGLDKRFGAGLILQLDTLTGRMNNLSDIIDLVLSRLTAPASPELTEALARLGDILQNEATLAAAEALGVVIGDIVRSVREWVLQDTSGILSFFTALPAHIQSAHDELKKLMLLAENFTLDLNLEGRPIFNAGKAQAQIDEITRQQKVFQEEAERVAQENLRFRTIELDLTARVRSIRADAARASLTVENLDAIDLSGFTDALSDEAELELARKLPASALSALNKFSEILEKEASSGEATGRSMAHVGAAQREAFLDELSKLGDNPSVARIDAAVERLGERLVIPGQFGASDADKDIIALAQSLFRLGVAQDDLTEVQAKLKQQTLEYASASHDEEAAIKTKEAAIRSLTEARKRESEAARDQIEDLRDRIDTERDTLTRGDRGFDAQIKGEEANIRRLKGIFDPILLQYKVAHDAAASNLEDLRARQERVSTAFEAAATRNARLTRDLQDARNVREAQYAPLIEQAERAEKSHQRTIKDATLDLRERVRVQDEEIDRIEEKYRGELRIKDLAVEEQSASLRAARREFNRQDLEFAKQIAAARARGDDEAVKALREQREQARIAFDESQDAARAELQVRQDQAEAVRDQADAEGRSAKQQKEDIQRQGQRNLDALERQGLALSDNKQALIDERDTALESFDRKIRVAALFAEVLRRTREDVETVGQRQLTAAEKLERDTGAALDRQETRVKDILDKREKIVQSYRDEKAEFDANQQGIIDGLTDQADQLERAERAAQRRHDAIVKPMQEEVDTLSAQHTANDILRQDELDKTKAVETGTLARIASINEEIDRLQALQTLQDSIATSATAQAKQTRAGVEPGAVGPDTTSQLIQGIINRQPKEIRKAIQEELDRARRAAFERDEFGNRRTTAEIAALFDGLIRDITQLSLKEGVSSQLSEEDIVRFLLGELPDSRQVSPVPGLVSDLIRAINTGDLGAVTEILRQAQGTDLVGQLTTALAGTATFAPNVALQREVLAALTRLQGQDADLAGGLQGLLAASGVRVDTQKGTIGVPGADELTTIRQENAADIQYQAALLQREAAQAQLDATLDPTLQESIDAVSQSILVQPRSGISFGPRDARASALDIERVLSGEGDFFAPLEHFQVQVLKALASTLRDEKKTALLVEQIRQNPAAFKELFDRLFPEGRNREVLDARTGLVPEKVGLSDSAFQTLRDALDAGMTDLNERATAAGAEIPQSFADGMDSKPDAVKDATNENLTRPAEEGFGALTRSAEKAGTDASDLVQKGIAGGVEAVKGAANEGIVTPITEGFGAITYAAGQAGAAVPGVVAGALNTEDNKAALKDATDAGVVQPISDGLSVLSTVASLAGLAGVKAAVDAIQGVNSEEAKRKTGEAATEFGTTFGGQTRAALTGEGADVENSPMWRLGEDSAGTFSISFLQAMKARFSEIVGSLSGILSLAGVDLQGQLSAQMQGAMAGQGQGQGQGGLGNPLVGERRVTTAFGQTYKPFGVPQKHMGLDIAASVGSTVYAVADGVVSFAGSADAEVKLEDAHGGYGYFVKIEHNVGGRKFSSIYAHLSKILVRKGASVTKGQAIGLVGLTGATNGPHLHFEVRDAQGVPFDPLPLLPKPGGVGGSGLPLLEQAMASGQLPSPGSLGSGSATSTAMSLLGGSQALSEADALIGLLRAAAQIVKEEGGDLGVVIAEALSGATEIAKDKLAGFSEEAQLAMQEAFEFMRAAIDVLGADGGEGSLARGRLRSLLQDAGLMPFDPVDELANLLAQAGAGGFADALKRQLIGGSTQTVADLLRTQMPTDLVGRLLVKLIEEQFGLNTPISKLAESLVSGGQLISPKFPGPVGERDPAATEAARLIREFALANRFLTDALGEQVEDPGITTLLKAIRDSEAKTLQELLAEPRFQEILADDSPLGRFAALLRDIAFKNPGLSLDDLQGFLFGGPGFEAVDVVDATNDVRDAVDTTNAILLGATDQESIEIWKALLTEWREQAPKIADATAESAQTLAQLLGEAQSTAENTGTTAENTAPKPAEPPPAPLTDEQKERLLRSFKLMPLSPMQGLVDRVRGLLGPEGFGVSIPTPVGDIPADAWQLLAGGTEELTEEQQRLIDSMKASLKPEDERIIALTDSTRIIKEELAARQRLIDMMNATAAGAASGAVPPSGSPPSAPPGGGGSGGPKAQGTTTIFNITEVNDPFFTAQTVDERITWGQRRLGENR